MGTNLPQHTQPDEYELLLSHGHRVSEFIMLKEKKETVRGLMPHS